MSAATVAQRIATAKNVGTVFWTPARNATMEI
jgi:hypothetical protein